MEPQQPVADSLIKNWEPVKNIVKITPIWSLRKENSLIIVCSFLHSHCPMGVSVLTKTVVSA